jgi:3-hydroxyisobutyrate dehydrogenase-like beta-hydroxyacid dehydrogenase
MTTGHARDNFGNSRMGISFIGFGEVGQTFARGLLSRNDVSITAYDRLFGTAAGERISAHAAELGIRAEASAKAACRHAQVVFSAVTASEAENVAKEAAGFLTAGQIFVDINSAAPATKRRAAEHVLRSGAAYVEGAVMAPVLKPGLQVPILAGGPQANEAAALLNGLGMKLTPVATEIGRASAMKLCRSIMIKGIEALMVDCAAACEAQDVKADVFASLAQTFPSIDWLQLSENMRERVATHGQRRAAEMREAGEMLQSLDIHPGLAIAVAEAQQRGAQSRLEVENIG